MDHFAHSSYHYHGTPNTAQPSQQFPHCVPQTVQSIQNQPHPGNVHMYSDSTWMPQTRHSLDSTASHSLHSHQRSASTCPRGAVHSDPTYPIKTYCMDGSADLSDQYIPSSSDKITCTDHRPLDEIFGNILLSSDWSQAKSSSVHPSPVATPRGHPRHTSVFTYPLPAKPQLDGVIQIPLLAVDNQMSGTGLVVDFRCSDWGIGVQVEGIPMWDLLNDNVSALENPNQRVLDGFGLTELRFNILWPHYPPFVKVISAFGRHGKPITRAELGYQVAFVFGEFFWRVTSQQPIPVQPGPYTISSFRSGTSPGINFDQLRLITVRNTSRGEWMAEVRAVSEP